MKTRQPLILTARIADADIEPFDLLRKRHFPPDRNFLRAHLTMFHRLPGERLADIMQHLGQATEGAIPIPAAVAGLRHLGAGVAFSIESPALQAMRVGLKSAFVAWLNSQDMQTWKPHITIQNKVPRAAADSLYKELGETFRPHAIEITGLDLWQYLNGPWQHEASVMFPATRVHG